MNIPKAQRPLVSGVPSKQFSHTVFAVHSHLTYLNIYQSLKHSIIFLSCKELTAKCSSINSLNPFSDEFPKDSLFDDKNSFKIASFSFQMKKISLECFVSDKCSNIKANGID